MTTRFPVWKTIHFQNLRYGFGALEEALKERGIRFYGPTGNARPKGPLSPKGSASLVLVTAGDLLAQKACSYNELLKRAQACGLKSARPAIGPQLLQDYKDQPADEEVHIASSPAQMGYDAINPSHCFAIYVVGKAERDGEFGHQYLEVRVMPDPNEKRVFSAETLWVFEST